MKEEVSCRLTSGVLRYVMNRGGDVRRLLEGFSLDEAHLQDPDNWIRVQQCQALFRRVERYFDKPGICYDIGFQAHRLGVLDALPLLSRPGKNARFLVEQVQTVGAHLHRVFTLHVRRISDANALVELMVPEGSELFKPDCDFFSGLLASIPTLANRRPAAIEHIQCAARIENIGTLDRFVYRVDTDGTVLRAPVKKPDAFEPAGTLSDDGTIDLDGVLYGTGSCLYRMTWKKKIRQSGWRRFFSDGSRKVSGMEKDFRLMEERYDELLKTCSRLEKRIGNLEEQLHLREAEIQRLNGVLERAERQSSEILSDMSHELRTPINAILGFADLLAQGIHGELNEKQKKSVERIGINTRNLLAILSDVLDFSRLEAGRVTLTLEPVAIRSLCEETVETILGMAQKKGLNVRLDIHEEVPSSFITDKTKFKQILLNLLSNAIKYTDEGSATLRVMHGQDFVFHVIDTGQGLTAAEQEQLFEKFTPVMRNSENGIPSSGLGLNITKRLVELLGGRIDVTSEWGVGSCFTITLPSIDSQFAPSSAEDEQETAVLSARVARSVLIVEADDTVVEFLKLAIEAEGFSVHTADDPDSALAKARALRPSLILLEPMLPRNDGWGLMRRLKEDRNTRDIPIVVHSVVDEPALAESLGADISLVKPAPSHRIIEIVLNLMEQAPAGRGDSG